MCENGQPGGHDDAVLVNEEALATAIESVGKDFPSGGFTFVETEPLLSSFCHAELLQILGKLAVAGASSGVVRGVGADIHRLVTAMSAAVERRGFPAVWGVVEVLILLAHQRWMWFSPLA